MRPDAMDVFKCAVCGGIVDYDYGFERFNGVFKKCMECVRKEKENAKINN